MKINLVETFTTPFVGFVRITAEDGSIGWGRYQPIIRTSPAPFCTGRSHPMCRARIRPFWMICWTA